MRVLDLFSGIGGFSLGLERAGHRTVAFCEIDAYCRAVLRKHWPAVQQYDDIRTLTAERLATDGIAVDLICGGFPCQDISVAGQGAGLAGERSGLWREYARLIGEIRPRFVIVENVAALLGRGLGDVLGDLASLGYDAEWDCVPASAVGAPHRRDRIWIVAHSNCERELQSQGLQQNQRGRASNRSADVPDSDRAGFSFLNGAENRGPPSGRILTWRVLERTRSTAGTEQWRTEPNVGRVANGVPARVDRITSLGNAVVPQIAEFLGHAINQI